MPNDKGYERMNELVSSLQRALQELEAGRLDPEGLERSTDEARALYERLVVLRHKARETRQHPPPPPSAPVITTAPPLRLDTRPPETNLRQTSLIDAIAETETPPEKPKAPPPPSAIEKPKAASPGPEKSPPAPPKGDRPSLAEKLEHAPVNDLHKAIALSQKFWFVAELFHGKREAYEQAIDAINAAASFPEAKAYIDREVTAKLDKPPDDEVLITFLELVQRRFS